MKEKTSPDVHNALDLSLHCNSAVLQLKAIEHRATPLEKRAIKRAYEASRCIVRRVMVAEGLGGKVSELP